MKIKNKKNRRKKIIISAALSLTVIGGVLYELADRYLIEHVETVVTPPVGTTTKTSSTSSVTTTAVSSGANSASSQTATDATSDDWNYKSSDIDISIKKTETGSGSDKITYYVADVQLKSSSNLLTAFAKNEFGRNITQDTSEIASANQAIFAINGDYYGFRDDGVTIRNGVLYRNEPAREGLALFNDGTLKSYDETKTTADELLAEGVTNTFSFGPTLVQNSVAVDDFQNVSIDTNFGNRSIDGANPRTGLGIISPNHYVFVVVDGRQENYSRGMTLNEFAKLFEDLGATEAYNLDGGGSSTMYFMGRVVNSPGSNGEERGVSDILFVTE